MRAIFTNRQRLLVARPSRLFSLAGSLGPEQPEKRDHIWLPKLGV